MIKHKLYDNLMAYAGARDHKGRRLPIILTGPASTGKSNACEQLAEELGMGFSYMACNQQMTKSDLIGFKTPNGDAVETLFTKAYTQGGIFVLEEMDAANPNVLLTLNTAIAGDTGSFATGIVKRHPDFLLVATANTYGGSTEQYSARAKLDASTLSRFLKIEWAFDEALEAIIVNNVRFHTAVKNLRKEMHNRGYELLMRDVISYHSLVKIGIPYEDAAKSTVIRESENNAHSKLLEILYVKPISKEPLVFTVDIEEKDPIPTEEELAEQARVEAEKVKEANEAYEQKMEDAENGVPTTVPRRSENGTYYQDSRVYTSTQATYTSYDSKTTI